MSKCFRLTPLPQPQRLAAVLSEAVEQRSFQLPTRLCRQYQIISVMHVNGTAHTQYTHNLPDTDHPVLPCSGV
jgi:hypothetical protein